MRTRIFWIATPPPGRLAIMPRPRGGDWLADEVEGWREAGLLTVLRLLTAEEVEELDLAAEDALCRAAGITLLGFAIPDMGVPRSVADAAEIAAALAARLRRSEAVAIHCRAGIGRSSVMAACTLLQLGGAVDRIFATIGAARGLEVPETEEQWRWVEAFASQTIT
jgi:protein-tyrosine phosphatase